MNNGSQQDVPPYVAQGAPKVNFNVGIKRINMNAKYYAALLATALIALSSYGADKLSVIFPNTTNLVFTVPINDKVGERPYDFFLEYPAEYENDGRPTKYERTGLGYYIGVEVIDETEDGVRCKLKVDRHSLSDWIPYTAGELVLLQPVLTSYGTETELTLPIGTWISLADDIESARIQFLYERKESQQGVAPYVAQGAPSGER